MRPNYWLRRLIVLLVLLAIGLGFYLWATTPDQGPCHFEGSNCVYTVQDR